MMYRLWHADPPNFLGSEKRALQLPTGYVHVADVECENLERLFEKTQHLEESWTANPTVPKVLYSSRIRSTSVGDVVEDPDGNFWLCESVGWRRIC